MPEAKTALLVIDVQAGMFDPAEMPHDAAAVLARVAGLIGRARATRTPVVYVQHAGGSERHPLHPDKPGHAIHPSIAPQPGEPCVVKRDPDAFQNTTLKATLDQLGVTRLVIAGLQTELCVDTTTRRAYAEGYDVVLASDAHTTWDTTGLKTSAIIGHHNATLTNWFATGAPAVSIGFDPPKP